ncbi:MAG: hypothetical protein FIA92_08520 [Chloroflexi bacterium]|nr:hypothetical protein [Chloroflexota bacterium]
MNGMDLMRVPGLGLAAATPNELMTEPRTDRHLSDEVTPSPTFQLHRLLEVFRPTARETAAPVERLPASPSGKDLARA